MSPYREFVVTNKVVTANGNLGNVAICFFPERENAGNWQKIQFFKYIFTLVVDFQHSEIFLKFKKLKDILGCCYNFFCFCSIL